GHGRRATSCQTRETPTTRMRSATQCHIDGSSLGESLTEWSFPTGWAPLLQSPTEESQGGFMNALHYSALAIGLSAMWVGCHQNDRTWSKNSGESTNRVEPST